MRTQVVLSDGWVPVCIQELSECCGSYGWWANGTKSFWSPDFDAAPSSRDVQHHCRTSGWRRIFHRRGPPENLLVPPPGWDNRQKKKGRGSPHFRPTQSQEVTFCKPAWRHTHLGVSDVRIGRCAFDGSLRYDPDLPKSAGEDRGIKAEVVSRLCREGHLTDAVEAMEDLVRTDRFISKPLFYAILKRCLINKDLVLGCRVHAFAVQKGYHSDTFLGFHILRMYASHGRLQDAMNVFEGIIEPDAFTWSAIISAHVEHGQDKQAIQLYHRMRRSSVKPDGHVFVAALQACARGSDLKAGQQVHADVLASSIDPDLFVSSCLVDMYAKCGSLEDAHSVFDKLGQKNVVTWTAMIAGYSKQGMGQEALRLYSAMEEEGVAVPNAVTFVCLLQACASVGKMALEKGKGLHTQIREQGHEADGFVANSLVHMYAKCGSVEDAKEVFDSLGHKDVVTWTAMIAGYSQQGMGQEALHLHCAMQEEGIAVPDSITFVCLLQACARVGTRALEKGKQLHTQIREQGHEADVIVANSLVNMYAKCGSLGDARKLFDGLGQKNVVTWNAIIAGYSQQGLGQEALSLYSTMQENMVVADSVTFVCLLQACANVAALYLGRQLHEQIAEQGLEADVFVGSLINMYGKSGSMVEAQQVFDASSKRDIVAWSALIAGYTSQGESEVVFDLVRRMREDGVWPDGITFLSVLTVCSHAGLVEKGWEYFEAMSGQYGIDPTVEHYGCMVDLLGRAGELDEALAFVRSMPVWPNASVWHTLLGACQKWGNVEVGRHAFNEAVTLDKEDAAAYVLMSNIYKAAQMWEQALELEATRKRIRARKQPGQSWWTDEDGLVHSFLVGDEKHPQSKQCGSGYVLKEQNKDTYLPHLGTSQAPYPMMARARGRSLQGPDNRDKNKLQLLEGPSAEKPGGDGLACQFRCGTQKHASIN